MIIHNLQITWATSKGRDTYGYNICRLDDNVSRKRYKTMGGGYDMVGTVIANWLVDQYQDRLQVLVEQHKDALQDCGYSVPGYKRLPDFYGLTITPKGIIQLDGACGVDCILDIIKACGMAVEWCGNRKGGTMGYIVYDGTEK